MSEAYTYGGDGSLARIEYNELNERDLGMYIEMVNDKLESFFLCAYPSREVDSTFHQTDDTMSRSINFQYCTTESDPETTLLLDTASGVLAEYVPPVVPIKNNVKIAYNQYKKGILQEEYIVAIDRNDAGTKGNFSNQYYFSRHAGNHWQARVSHNDIEGDTFYDTPSEGKSKYYSREMTPYDFDEFFKDTAEINTQLRLRLVQ